MDTLQCAIVLAKLERFEWEVAQRERLGRRYTDLLGDKVQVVAQRPDRTSVFAQYTVLVPNRDGMQEALKSAGIPTAVHYPVPIHLQPAYRGLCEAGSNPVSEQRAQMVMSLPFSPDLDDAGQATAVQALIAALR